MPQFVDLELYQRVKTGWRRAALLPDVDDVLCDAVKLHYQSPKYMVRLVTRIW